MLFCRLSFLKERFTLAVVVHWKLVSDTIYSLTSRMYRIGSHPRCVPDHTSALLCLWSPVRCRSCCRRSSCALEEAQRQCRVQLDRYICLKQYLVNLFIAVPFLLKFTEVTSFTLKSFSIISDFIKRAEKLKMF